MRKIVVDDKIPFIRGEVEKLAEEVVYLPGAKINAEDVKDADALVVRTRTLCDARLLDGSNVKKIVTATIGYDHIDTEYCDSNGISWTNCPGCNANSVATYIKNTLRFLVESSVLKCEEIVLGVIGVGHVGSIVVKNAKKAGMRVVCYDPFVFPNSSLQPILEEADVITFHVPLTHDAEYPTSHMANEQFFASLHKNPIVINTSRGGVVNEQALLRAMDEGKVRGAVIDTWENEPDINRELLRRALIATPHIAGYSVNGKMNATKLSLASLGLKAEDLELSEEILENCEILSVATLMSDSELLKAMPERFEEFRGNYPRRKE